MALTVEAIMNNLMAYPEVAIVGFAAGYGLRLIQSRKKRRQGGMGGGGFM